MKTVSSLRNVCSFGASAEFWQQRLFDFKDGQGGLCVQSAVQQGRYRKLVFQRKPQGGRKLLGGILLESTEVGERVMKKWIKWSFEGCLGTKRADFSIILTYLSRF